MKRIIKHGVPDWLLLLPAGKYTIPEIADITKQKEGNVYVRMRVLNVERIHSRRLNYPSKIYVWLGAEHYLNEILKRKRECLTAPIQKECV
jgi:hypothetical protein